MGKYGFARPSKARARSGPAPSKDESSFIRENRTKGPCLSNALQPRQRRIPVRDTTFLRTYYITSIRPSYLPARGLDLPYPTPFTRFRFALALPYFEREHRRIGFDSSASMSSKQQVDWEDLPENCKRRWWMNVNIFAPFTALLPFFSFTALRTPYATSCVTLYIISYIQIRIMICSGRETRAGVVGLDKTQSMG